jgi:HPt (histidine-containing phosphotransfer) domain-containing protein
VAACAMARQTMAFEMGSFLGAAASRELKPEGLDLSKIGPEPIDFVHLRRFTQGDKALENEVLELFVRQMPETIKALKGAATDKEWHVAAHTLKGSGRAVGAWRLADLALQAESVPGVADREAVAKMVARIESAAGDVQRFIESLNKSTAR